MNWKKDLEEALASLRQSAETLKAAAENLRRANELRQATNERWREINRKLVEANECLREQNAKVAATLAKLNVSAATGAGPPSGEPLELEEPIQPPGSGRYETVEQALDGQAEESKTIRRPTDPTKLN